MGKKRSTKEIYVIKRDDSTINYLALNDFTFQDNEIVTFEDSAIEATISSSTLGSNNKTEAFTYDDGQRSTIYDYARRVRRSPNGSPSESVGMG